MPNIKCMCNERISYGSIPCADEWLMISDVEYDNFSDNVDAEVLYNAMTHTLKCPNCQRLLVFWNGFRNPPTFYVAE